MRDTQVTIQELKALVQKFVEERDWGQFHNPKNLSIGIALEAAELLEQFQWCSTEASYDQCLKHKEAISHELADVVIYALNFARVVEIDLSAAIQEKMILNAQKYPVEKAKGKSTKYTQL